ncbi:Abc transporter c family member 5 [Globisporangium polare]
MERTGIVDRTGAGKSSIAMALIRIQELDSGCILIDGEGISSVPLRSQLSIVPQASVLFKGSLRAYTDPFDEFSDAEIWPTLEKVAIKTQIGGHHRNNETRGQGLNVCSGLLK